MSKVTIGNTTISAEELLQIAAFNSPVELDLAIIEKVSVCEWVLILQIPHFLAAGTRSWQAIGKHCMYSHNSCVASNRVACNFGCLLSRLESGKSSWMFPCYRNKAHLFCHRRKRPWHENLSFTFSLDNLTLPQYHRCMQGVRLTA
jgi:hypothetical protein